MIRVAILTVSDGVSRGTRQDRSGAATVEWVERRGWAVAERKVVPDETVEVVRALLEWSDGDRADLILTIGGTGFGPRDVTPEATASVLDRIAPGIAEALRADGAARTPYAVLSRGMAGIRGRALIVNLPGSERAVREGLAVLDGVVGHAIDLLAGRTEHE